MRRRFRFLIILLIVVTVWIFAAPFLASYLIVQKSLPKADALVILGGSSVYLERTQKAAMLFRQGVAPKIFLTDDGEKGGWSQSEQRNPPFVDLARNELIANGVPEDAISIFRPEFSGTIYEAEMFAEVVRIQDLKSVIIVTSAYHSKRALWTFEKYFSDNNIQAAVGIEHALTDQQTPSIYSWWFSPVGWQMVAGEYGKGLYYFLKY